MSIKLNMDLSENMSNPEIDWENINQRIVEMKKRLEQNLTYTREEKQAILKSRAEILAREYRLIDYQTEFAEIIGFRLASETYGIETKYVRETFPLKDFTAVPGTPPFVLGIINVRGKIISVLNVKKFFGLPETGIGELNKVIILYNDEMEFGILADEIIGIRKTNLAKLQQSLPTLNGIREEYLSGITDDWLIVLNADKLLLDKNILVDDENVI